MRTDLQAIILAAGKSTRFNTGNTKLVEKICGQELILYSTTLLEQMDIPTTIVVGHQKDAITAFVKKRHENRIRFVCQEEQHGTGHALLCARDSWHKKDVLIMHGDMPLLTEEIINALYQKHVQTNATISFVTAHNSDPSSYAYDRIIKTDDRIKILQASELNKNELHEHCCIDAGVYIVCRKFLEENSNEIERNMVSNEMHITDLVKIASEKGCMINTISAPFDIIRGINTYQELWPAEQVKRAELIRHWMNNGVRFSIAQNVHIDLDVTIGAGTFIGCGVHLLRGTKIGKQCTIDAFSLLKNTVVEDDATVHPHCVIKDTTIGKHAQVGPFAHVRDNTTLAANSTIGTFVEVNRSTVGKHTNARHLTYLGDTQIGSHVNIGAGTITCNFDGINKQKTVIKDHAYVGSNNSIVAPVTINKHAFTAAGSVITDDVPADALAIARARQTNKPGYAQKLRERKQQKDEKKEQKPEPADDTLSFIGAVKTNSRTTAEE